MQQSYNLLGPKLFQTFPMNGYDDDFIVADRKKKYMLHQPNKFRIL